MNETTKRILIGNAFPMGLIRGHRVEIREIPVEELRTLLADAEVASFWGHENTRAAAEALLGVSLAPRTARPAVSLSPEGLPMLDGDMFDTCWLLSPDYPEGFRPAIGVEVGLDLIKDWHVLKLTWQQERNDDGN